MVAIQIFPRDFDWRKFGLIITFTVSAGSKTDVPHLKQIFCALIFL